MTKPLCIKQLQQSGFTIIELVVVIVVLAVLAATALPKFMSFGRDARIASLNGLASSMKSAASLAHAKCMLTANCDVNGWSNDVIASPEDATLRPMYNGYPTSDINASHISLWMTSSGFVMDASDVNFTLFSISNAPNPTTCSVKYEYALNFGEQPRVTIDTNGC